MLATLFFRFVDVTKQPHLELALVVIAAMAPFMLAQAAGLSGVIATLFNAITMSHYLSRNLSDEAQRFTTSFFSFFGLLSETFVFLYLGIQVLGFPHQYEVSVIIAATILVLIARIINVFPIMSVVNFTRKPHRQINYKQQTVLFWSGLRGAIAFVLALLIEPVTKNGSVLVSTTLVIVLITTFIFGGSENMNFFIHSILIFRFLKILAVHSLLSKFGLISEIEHKQFEEDDDDDDVIPVGTKPDSLFVQFDRHYFKPLLVRNYNSSRNSNMNQSLVDKDRFGCYIFHYFFKQNFQFLVLRKKVII